MQMHIEIVAAMVMLDRVMPNRHIFDDTVQDRGAGVLQYILEIGDQKYLARLDDDSETIVVSPFHLWDAENLMDVIDDSVPIWFLCNGEAHRRGHGFGLRAWGVT